MTAIDAAIDQAKQIANAYDHWVINVDKQDDIVEVSVSYEVDLYEKSGFDEPDAPWSKLGGDQIMQPLLDAGFRQADSWLNVYERKTFGGGTVQAYEDGVLMVAHC